MLFKKEKGRFKKVKAHFKNKKGFSTVEVVILIAVIVGLALIFRTSIIGFVSGVIGKMFPADSSIFDNSKP